MKYKIGDLVRDIFFSTLPLCDGGWGIVTKINLRTQLLTIYWVMEENIDNDSYWTSEVHPSSLCLLEDSAIIEASEE